MSEQQRALVHQVAREVMPAIYETAMKTAHEDGLFQHVDWQIGLALDAYRMAEAFAKVSDAFEAKYSGENKENLDIYV